MVARRRQRLLAIVLFAAAFPAAGAVSVGSGAATPPVPIDRPGVHAGAWAGAQPGARQATHASPQEARRGARASAESGRPGVNWRPCPEDPSAECTTVPVPVDWSRPYGPRVGIAVARRPATDPASRLGLLVINPGGPGGSGVDFALGGASFFSERLRRRFDLLGIDPRGVARSGPVRCPAHLVAAAPTPLLSGLDDFTKVVTYNRRLAAGCRSNTGPLYDHVDTASAVRDLEAVRAALGERVLSFYGTSYGTLTGQLYAQRYPHRVRAAVLDSAMDPRLDTADFLTTAAAAVEDSFAEFASWCDRDASCALHGRDVHAIWRRALVRADRGRLRDPIEPGRWLTAFDVLSVALDSLYGPEWYALAYYLAGLNEPAAPGPGAGYGAERAAMSRREPLVEDPFAAVFCLDWRLPVRNYAEYVIHRRRMARVAPHVEISPLALGAVMSCVGRGGPSGSGRSAGSAGIAGVAARVGQSHRAARVGIARAAARVELERPGRSRPPLLIVHARYDPATPYAWARSLAARLRSGAVLVTYEGWGHTAYGRGPCMTRVVDGYLLALAVPAAHAGCPPIEPEPFGIESGRLAGVHSQGPLRGVPGWRPSRR